MNGVLSAALEVALLVVAYAGVDLLVRRDGALRVLRALRLPRGHLIASLGVALLSGVWRWSSVPGGDAIALLATVLVGACAWKAITKDVDVVTGQGHFAARRILLALAFGVPLSPACLVAALLLLTTPLGLWQHHATLPMRLGQATAAYATLATLAAFARPPFFAAFPGAPLFADPGSFAFFALTIPISHYLITALAKIWLGPRWYSWVWDNQLHHLACSAYSWGWARWMPWTRWRRVVDVVRRVQRPMQAAAFGVELLAPLALLAPRVAMGFLITWALFHAGVFLLSGLLFWDWMIANIALASTLALLPQSSLAPFFGKGAVLAGIAFLVLFPLRHRLWKPMPLGWWDSPFTQRMRWYAKGESGAVYEVYNDFMCPHERIYGKVHGCFLAPRSVCTYHLGEVWKHELRDALRAAGPDEERLAEVRERFGIVPRSESLAARHRAYLQRFFLAINAGARKHVLPRGLRWLKAPGGQCFYWGEGERFRGQEAIVEVRLRYREEYFDGERLVRLCDELVEVIPIEEPAMLAAREPTPKELDDFLLGFARGRLVDLPNFGRGYVESDDG